LAILVAMLMAGNSDLVLNAANSNAPVGVNLDYFNYYDPSCPFKNIWLMNLGTWSVQTATSGWFGTGDPFSKDVDGYPITPLAPGHWYQMPMVLNGGHYPSGDYVFLYDGEGTFSVQGDATNLQGGNGRMTFTVNNPSGGMELNILSFNSDNHPRNFRIVPALYENDFVTEPFNPVFASQVAHFSAIRFMTWSSAASGPTIAGTVAAAGANTLTLDPTTNPSNVDDFYKGQVFITGSDSGYQRQLITGYDGASHTATVSPPWNPPLKTGNWYSMQFFVHEWSERASTSSIGGSADGIPIEYMIALCNQTNVSPWFTMPTLASDDYIQQFATLVKNTLNPNLKIYVQFSNETWNYYYPGFNGSAAMGSYLGIGGAYEYEGYRATQIHKIWDDVFGEPHLRADRQSSRLVRILGAQEASSGSGVSVMDFGKNFAGEPMNNHPASDYADVLAIADYFGYYFQTDLDTKSIPQLVNEIKSDMDANNKTMTAVNLANAQARGLSLVAYEGGTGFVLGGDATPARSAKLKALCNDPGMRSLVTYNLNRWNALGQDSSGHGVSLWNAFTLDGTWSDQYGYWGFMTSYDQPPEQAQKYSGLLDYLNEGPIGGPYINAQPTDQTVVASQNATFSISASGTGPLSYDWQVSNDSGKTFVDAGGTSDHFSFNASTPQSGQLYRCMVFNTSATAISNNALLTVNSGLVAPSFVTPPSDQTVFAGQRAIFSVTVDGTPPRSYQWMRSGDGGQTWNNVGSDSPTYTTDSVNLSDNGVYQFKCAVSNAVGTVVSNSVNLFVMPLDSSGNGLVGYWKFDETSGTVAADSSGQGNDGTLNNFQAPFGFNTDAAPTPYPDTGSLAFDGLGDSVSVPITPSLQTSLVTVAFWLKVPGLSSWNDDTFFVNATDGKNGWRFWYRRWNGDSVTFETLNDGKFLDVLIPKSLINDGGWHHLTGVYDGTNMKTYVDGALQNSVYGATMGPITATTMTIGAFLGSPAIREMDDVRVYNRALSDLEIQALAASGTRAPSITTQPQNATVSVGQTAHFSITAAGMDPLSYQWEKSSDNGLTWTVVGSSPTLTTGILNVSDSETQYQCTISNNAGSITSALVTQTVLPSDSAGLVGYWKFDDVSWISAQDSSGYGNTGNLNKFVDPYGFVVNILPPPVSFADARRLSFNGKDDFVSLNVTPSLSSPLVSVALWIKTMGLNNNAPSLLVDNSSAVSGWTLKDDGAGQITFQTLANGISAGPSFPRGLVNDGLWHHIAGVFDGASAKIYCDGLFQQSVSAALTPSTVGSTARIGVFQGNGGESSLDEVQVYNRALSDKDVADLAALNSPPLILSQPQNQIVKVGQSASFTLTANGVAPLTYQWQQSNNGGQNWANVGMNAPTYVTNALSLQDQGVQFRCVVSRAGGSVTSVIVSATIMPVELVGYWKLDEPSGSVALDSSGNGFNGIYYNNPLPSSSVAPVLFADPECYVFNGSNQYIEAPTISVPSDITVSVWAYSSDFNQSAMLVEKEPVNASWELFFEYGILKWRGGDQTSEVDAARPSAGAWHHFAATQQGTHAVVYVDGIQVSSGEVTALGNGNGLIEIGRFAGGANYTSGYYFNGSLDDVRIYNRAFSADEIRQLAASIQPPPQNQPPVVNAGINQTIKLPALALLNGSATDDGLPNPPGKLSVQWSVLSGPGAVTFSDASSLQTTAQFSVPGVYDLHLSASDGALTTSSDVTITVNPPSQNQPPVVNAGTNQTIQLPATASLNGSATDDGLPNPPGKLSVQWSVLSGPGAVTFSDPSSLQSTAQFSVPGVYDLNLSASDGALTTSSDVTITVNPPDDNQPPSQQPPGSAANEKKDLNVVDRGKGKQAVFYNTDSVTIFNRFGTALVTVHGSNETSLWDGKDDHGNFLPPGIYPYRKAEGHQIFKLLIEPQ